MRVVKRCSFPGCDRKFYGRELCMSHYDQWHRGVPLSPIRPRPMPGTPKERLYRHTQPEPNSGCLLWLGGVGKSGYGKMGKDGKTPDVHRVVWELERGPIPEGMCVCHKCDTRTCVNIDHLFLGTYSDNMQDMYAKGRGIKSRKLKAADLVSIKAKYAAGETFAKIGADHGIAASYVYLIVTGRQNPRVAA